MSQSVRQVQTHTHSWYLTETCLPLLASQWPLGIKHASDEVYVSRNVLAVACRLHINIVLYLQWVLPLPAGVTSMQSALHAVTFAAGVALSACHMHRSFGCY